MCRYCGARFRQRNFNVTTVSTLLVRCFWNGKRSNCYSSPSVAHTPRRLRYVLDTCHDRKGLPTFRPSEYPVSEPAFLKNAYVIAFHPSTETTGHTLRLRWISTHGLYPRWPSLSSYTQLRKHDASPLQAVHQTSRARATSPCTPLWSAVSVRDAALGLHCMHRHVRCHSAFFRLLAAFSRSAKQIIIEPRH